MPCRPVFASANVLIDSHCHWDFPVFEANRQQDIAAFQSAQVGGIVVPGVEAQHWPRIAELRHRFPDLVWAAFGLHPCFEHQDTGADLRLLEQQLASNPCVAVGEIGLDFYDSVLPHSVQQELFAAQLAIARDAQLPVIIHCRKAHDQCWQAIKRVGLEQGGIIHAFSGSLVQAQRYIDTGFKLGIGGAATYPRAKRLHRLIKTLPLSSFVLETDAPDMPPAFARGQPNSPLNLLQIVHEIAHHTDLEPLFLANTCTLNTKAVLKL